MDKGNYHEVVLYDNSPSIPDSEVANLFNPLKRSGGLELLIIQQIIERFNGKIKATNNATEAHCSRTEYHIEFPKIE